jgi:YbgC/YbaW family acyl-CoA thioester hydrolase
MNAAAPTPSPMPSIETEEEVMFFDTDAGGVVHNTAYLRFVETCRTRLGAHLGLDVRSMAARQQFAAIVRTEIDYRRPALLADRLVVRGWLEQVERARFWCAFEIHRPSDGARLVTCRQLLALLQLPSGRPLRLPDDWRTRWPELTRAGA